MAKASVGKRVVAYLIDAVLVMALVIGFVFVIGFGGSLVIGILAATLKVDALAMLSIPLVFGGVGLAILSALGYWLLRDGLFGGRSMGKKLMGLKVSTKDGKACDYVTSLKRNITLVIPILNLIELIMGLVDKDGLRFGDKIANTQVVE